MQRSLAILVPHVKVSPSVKQDTHNLGREAQRCCLVQWYQSILIRSRQIRPSFEECRHDIHRTDPSRRKVQGGLPENVACLRVCTSIQQRLDDGK